MFSGSLQVDEWNDKETGEPRSKAKVNAVTPLLAK